MPNIDYTFSVQKLYLEMFLSDAETFIRCQNIFDPENFDRKLKDAAEFISNYVDKYKVMPELDIVNTSCETDFKDVTGLPPENYDWLLDEFETFSRHKALERAIIKSADLLEKGELGYPGGYAQWLETLAAVHVDGVWLQGLDIGKAGQSVSISGKSLNADAVLRYIDQVNEAFKPMNVRFGAMEITQDPAASDPASARQTATLSFKIY